MSLYSTLDGQRPMDRGADIQSTELIRTNKIDREFFAQYISYARKTCKPKIHELVQMDLVQEYVRMRSLGNSKKTITATPRQLESMIRIAESIAKMRLSPWVEKKDIDEAVRLIKTAMQQSATDPTTGEINMDIINTGRLKSSFQKVQVVIGFLRKTFRENRGKGQVEGFKYGNLFGFVQEKVKDGTVAKDFKD